MDNFKVATALRQGISHKADNTPCQDAIKVVKRDNFIFLGIADGAGSKLYAKEAAEFILNRLALEFEEMIGYYLISSNIEKELIIKIESILHTYSEVYNIDYNQLSSTLIFVVISNNQCLIGHIGDGVVATLENNTLIVKSEPQNFEYANETVFCNSEFYSNRLRLQKCNYKSIKNGIILASDGVEDTIYNYSTNSMANICKTMINWLDIYNEEEVSEGLYYNLEHKISKLSNDDLSIIVAKGVTSETV